MNASRKLSLSKPVGEEAINTPTLAYFRARTRRKLHTLILEEFKKSGLSQAVLRKRLKKDAAQISRILQSPGNWSLDTVSDLLFAMTGAEVSCQAVYPLDAPARNFRAPEWMAPERVKSSGTSKSSEFVLFSGHEDRMISKIIRGQAAVQ